MQNPISANGEYTPHEADVTCAVIALIQAKSLKKNENICYKMVYYTLYLSQSSEIALEIRI